MADDAGVDTPAANQPFIVRADTTFLWPTANNPSPGFAAENFMTPPLGFIEIDPPARTVEFYYSRLLQQTARWRGVDGPSDSMRVRAMSRTPGTLSYRTYDSEILHSNVPSIHSPWNVWTQIKLTAPDTLIGLVWFDGHIFIDDLKVTRAPPDTAFWVSVDCPSATRGDQATCNVSWNPPEALANDILFEWSFQGDSVWVFPDNASERFDPPPQIDSSGQGMVAWSGTAATAGDVSVTGTWQGRTDSDTSFLWVSLRNTPEFGDLKVNFEADTADLTGTAVVSGKLTPSPSGENFDTVTKLPFLLQLIQGDPVFSTVQSGPNTGLWYVTDATTVQSHRQARLNVWYTGRGSPLFDYSHAPGLLTNRGLLEARFKNSNGNGPRQHKNDSTGTLTGVWAHEATGSSGKFGHQQQIELAAKGIDVCGAVPYILEKVVAGDSAAARTIADLVILEGKKTLFARSDHDRVFGNFTGEPMYEVVTSPTVVSNRYSSYPALSVGDQPKQPANPGAVPDPRFLCARTF